MTHVLKQRTRRDMVLMRAGAARRVEQLAAFQARKKPEADRQVVGPESRGAHFADRLAHGARRQRHTVDIAQLALVGAEPQSGVALDVFYRLESFTDRQFDVAGRHVVLVVDKGLGTTRYRGVGLGNPERADRLSRRFDYLCWHCACAETRSRRGGRPGLPGFRQGLRQRQVGITRANEVLVRHRRARHKTHFVVVPAHLAT